MCVIYGRTWVNYDEFCSDRQIPILYNRRIELSKSFLPSPSSCLHYLLTLLGLALLINLDPTHSILLRLPNFRIS